MSGIKLVLFDLGGVLIDYPNSFITAGKHFSINPKPFDETFDKYVNELTLGKMTPQEMYQTSVSAYNLNIDINYNFIQAWVDDYKPIPGISDLVQKASEVYEVGILSNIYPGIIEKCMEENLIPKFPHQYIFLSCKIGYQKPESEIYKYVELKSKLNPDQIFFIDDREDYIAGALKSGWSCFLFNKSQPEESILKISQILGV